MSGFFQRIIKDSQQLTPSSSRQAGAAVASMQVPTDSTAAIGNMPDLPISVPVKNAPAATERTNTSVAQKPLVHEVVLPSEVNVIANKFQQEPTPSKEEPAASELVGTMQIRQKDVEQSDLPAAPPNPGKDKPLVQVTEEAQAPQPMQRQDNVPAIKALTSQINGNLPQMHFPADSQQASNKTEIPHFQSRADKQNNENGVAQSQASPAIPLSAREKDTEAKKVEESAKIAKAETTSVPITPAQSPPVTASPVSRPMVQTSAAQPILRIDTVNVIVQSPAKPAARQTSASKVDTSRHWLRSL
ncbi:hypothetical protein P2G88_03700 [Aliiglaciecola sp. CAU 1673]|uniref:hypothetical protein n=1 Tax=Aliiglaciecola sp. CAU 1673 TaxID=3032595 RepID=UPI0023DA0C34|nr:hypothetical protein [Aliiglaciecola sp. CAU 1673]MDF2177348.1 hypothetical protein [Aliiglaciecola sp. CAU 1673]